MVANYNRLTLTIYDDEREKVGEVAYYRGLVDHSDYFGPPEIAQLVNACRNTKVLMSQSQVSSSDYNPPYYADDEASSSSRLYKK